MAERKKTARVGATALRVPLARARAHWHRIQGLAAAGRAPLEEVVAATGWPRTLGGVDVYLALRARVPGLRRADLDRAVLEARLQVIPAVRGCIYLVPRAEAPLCLRVAEEPWRKRADYDLSRVGVPWREVATFRPLPGPRRRALEALAAETAAFLRDDMGHAKSFSLDTREAIRERAVQVKAM